MMWLHGKRLLRGWWIVSNINNPVKVVITTCSNPFSWYSVNVGNTFVCEWFPIWGKYRVINRKGMHTDDQTIRSCDCIALID